MGRRERKFPPRRLHREGLPSSLGHPFSLFGVPVDEASLALSGGRGDKKTSRNPAKVGKRTRENESGEKAREELGRGKGSKGRDAIAKEKPCSARYIFRFAIRWG